MVDVKQPVSTMKSGTNSTTVSTSPSGIDLTPIEPNTEIIDDALAQIVPSSDELVDHLNSKFIRTGGSQSNPLK